MTNHPVHIIDKYEDNKVNLNPTALIPFCSFGGKLLGIKIDQFDVPVCDSFRPRIIKDQMCYTVDPNKHKKVFDLEGDLAFALLLHYNEDRQMEDVDSSEKFSIIVGTIGTIKRILDILIYKVYNFLEPLKLAIGTEYNMNNVKEVKVTDDFLTLARETIGCQNDESIHDCNTEEYMDSLKKQCTCFPYSIMGVEKVTY